MLFIAGILFILLMVLIGPRLGRVLIDMRAMTPLDTGEVVAGVYAVRNTYVNMYLLKDKEQCIAIDAGIKPDAIRREMEKLKIDPLAVSAVFLTHGDSDHTGGLSLFRNAKIYLAREEEQMVSGKTSRFMFYKNGPIPRHTLVDDGQTVVIGGLCVRGILSPGHTPGSMCYLVDGRLLFTGDSMRLRRGKADIFSQAINMDSDTQRESLKRLARLEGVELVFTGHFGYGDAFDSMFEAFESLQMPK